MKKLLTVCIVLATALAIHASANDNTKALCDKMNVGAPVYTDTVPSDTSKKDTMFASAVAYRLVSDTVPTDTTEKDTTAVMLSFNR